MIYKEDIVDINLNTGNIHRTFLAHTIGYKDQKADHFGVRVFRDGEAVDLTGVSVQGIFMPPQGDPIAITSGNSVSGNVAYVVLPQACYNYDGQFCLAIKLVDSTNSITGTVRIVDGVVDNTHASGTVAPTSAVPTYQEILSTYDAMVAATAAANGCIAATYSSSATYAVGDYCIHDGGLYRCTTAITTAEAWTSGHWTAAKIGPDVSALKSALENASNQPIQAIYLNDLELLQGYIDSANNYVSNNLNFCRTNMLDVSDTESIVVNLVGSTTNVATIACYDSNMNFLSDKSKKETFSGTFTIPEGVKYIIISTNINRKNYPCDIICKSVNIDDAFSTNAAQLTRAKNDIVTTNEQIITAKKIDHLTLHSGYIDALGSAVQNSYYSYTNLLDVSETADINVNLIGVNTNIAVIACYDENGHFSVSDSIIQASYNGTFAIPNGIKYIRLTTSNATIGNECSIVCRSTLLEDAFLTRDKNNEVAMQITNDVSTKEDMYYEVPASDRTVHSGAFLKSDGTEKDGQDGIWRYETISVSVGEKFLVTSHAGVSALLWIVLNSNGGVVAESSDTSALSKKTETVVIPPNGATLAVNEQMNVSSYLLDVSIKRIVNTNLIDQDKVETGKETLIDYIASNNTLFGKILCCCGDSITYGADLEDAGFTNSDVVNVYNWSGTGASGSWVQTTTGIRMTYGWHIARRNHMTFYNGGVSGSTMQGILDKNGFSLANGRYTQLPNNIDYLTIFFGWNDKTYGTLGEITDTTNESYYGAYNVVMPYLINKYPYAKICLIVPFGTDEGHRNAIRLLADKWGVACFDMMQRGTPLYWGKESNVNVDADIITENRTKFQYTPTSAHPNRHGHKQIADMLEHFLRGI